MPDYTCSHRHGGTRILTVVLVETDELAACVMRRLDFIFSVSVSGFGTGHGSRSLAQSNYLKETDKEDLP